MPVILSRVTQAHTQWTDAVKPLVISAPFGNYIQPDGATATLGTFTAARRPGRVWRILRTVRYYRRLGAWVNRIGLRNPGMPWLVRKVEAGRVDVADKLVSIHGFNEADWTALLEQAARIRPLAIELNMSCPNVGEIDRHESLFHDAVATGLPVVVKLPPIRYEQMLDHALEAGVTAFHCCNTLPVPAGGMSGRPLKPIVLGCVRGLRSRPEGGRLTIIGGGGVCEPADIDDYLAAGADRVALGVRTMNPRLLFTDRPIRPLIDHAAARLAPAGADAGRPGEADG